MTDFAGGAWWPERRMWGLAGTEPGNPWMQHLSTYTMSGADGSACACILQAPFTGTLRGFTVLLAMLSEIGTGPPSPGLFNFSLQSLDATGWPSGSGTAGWDFDSGAFTANEFTAVEVETGPFDVERGDLVACVFALPHTGISTFGSLLCTLSPRYGFTPHWGLFRADAADDWHVLGGTLGVNFVPAIGLHYETGGPDRAAGDILPHRHEGRVKNGLVTAAPVSMVFTVPRSLRCDAASFQYDEDVSPGPIAFTLTGGAVAVTAAAPDGGFLIPFDAEVVLRPGQTYTATLTPLSGTLRVCGAFIDPAMLTDFEGGPTWTALGDPAELVNRWFFSLRLSGTAEEEAGTPSGVGGVGRCVVIPVCPEAEEPGPATVTPTRFASWQPGQGPLRLRGRRRGR